MGPEGEAELARDSGLEPPLETDPMPEGGRGGGVGLGNEGP